MNVKQTKHRRVDYGLDAPGIVRSLTLLGSLAVTLGTLGYYFLHSRWPALASDLLNWSVWPGLAWLTGAGAMVWGSRVGKLRLRDQLLNRIPWRGDEWVLDVGCGHGLLLIGAAKRMSTGKAIGVDIWQSKDQAGNRPEATSQNAAIEGVIQRIVLVEGDARRLPFPDDSFDIVVSSWALHNIPTQEGRDQAVREIARVLKSGGEVAILDLWYARNYVRVLRANGVGNARQSFMSFCFALPTFRVVGCKGTS